MKKLYTHLLIGLTCLISLNLSAQSFNVTDVNSGNTSSYPLLMTTFGNKMFFQFDEPTMNYYKIPAYLKENGDVVKLKWPQGLLSEGYGTKFFDLNGQPIWLQQVYDPILDQSFRALSIMRNDSIVFLTSNNNGNGANNLVVYNNKAYITYYADSVGSELFSYDGTSFSLAQDINPGTSGSFPQEFLTHNGKLYFNALTLSGFKVFETDGSSVTELNIPKLSYTFSGTYASNGNDLYYVTTSTNPASLVHYNGTTATTIYNNINGQLYFIYGLKLSGNEIYMTGINNGPYRLTKYDALNGMLVPVATGVQGADIIENFNDTLFFNGQTISTGNYGLNYLVPVIDTAVHISNFDVNSLAVENNKLYATLNDINVGYEVFVFQNDTMQLVADINTFGDSYPYEFETFAGQLIVNADTENLGNELVALCITPVTAPTVPTTQTICEDKIVSDLDVNGTNINYFSSISSTVAIDPTDEISNYTTVYALSHVVCPSDRVTVPFTVSLLPQTPISHFGNGLLKVLAPATSYQWINCQTGDSIAGETGQTFQANQNGAYQCILTNADGCSVLSDCIYVANLGIADNAMNAVNVFPNPAKEFISIESSQEMKSFELTSLAGQVVKSQTANGLSATLSLEQTNNGVYILTVYGQNNEPIGMHRIVVNK